MTQPDLFDTPVIGEVRERLLARLVKLQAKAESAQELGNVREAEAFAAKVSELLIRHKLSMTDLEFAQEYESEGVESTVVPPAAWGGRPAARRVRWVEDLAQVIAEAHGCRSLVYPGSNLVGFAGRYTDRVVVVYLFRKLARDLTAMCETAHSEAKARREWSPRTWRRSWRTGAVDGLYSRLAELRREAEAESGSNALVRLSGEAVDSWLKDNSVGTAEDLKDPLILNNDAYRDGRRAAGEVSLSPGVGPDSKSHAQLRGGAR